MTKKKIINLFALLSMLSISAIGASTAEERFEAALETSQYRNTDDVFKNLVHILEDEGSRTIEEKKLKDLKLHFAGAIIRSVETIFEQIAKYREIPCIYGNSSKEDVDLFNSLKAPSNGLTEVAFASPHSDTTEEIKTKHLIQLGILAEIQVSCMAYKNTLETENKKMEELRFNNLFHSIEQYSNYLDSFLDVARTHPHTDRLTADRLIEPYDPTNDEQRKRWKEDPRREPKIKEQHRQSLEVDPAILHTPEHKKRSPEEEIANAEQEIAYCLAKNTALHDEYIALVRSYDGLNANFISAFRSKKLFLDNNTIEKVNENEKIMKRCYSQIISDATKLSKGEKDEFKAIYGQLEHNLGCIKEMINYRQQLENQIAEMARLQNQTSA